MNFLRLKGAAEQLLTCGLQVGRAITLDLYEATEHLTPSSARPKREALTLCIPHLQDPGCPRCWEAWWAIVHGVAKSGTQLSN